MISGIEPAATLVAGIITAQTGLIVFFVRQIFGGKWVSVVERDRWMAMALEEQAQKRQLLDGIGRTMTDVLKALPRVGPGGDGR